MRLMFVANVIVAGSISIACMFYPKTALSSVFTNAFQYSEAFRLVGALWFGIFALSLIGIFHPKQMALVFLFQFIYKFSYLLVGALPAMLNSNPFPKSMSLFFLIWVLILPFVIPWKILFS